MIEVQSSSTVNPCNTIPSPGLKQAIERCLFCTTKEVYRYALNVVRFTSDGETLTLESADRSRLSRATLEAELPAFSILVPVDRVKALKKISRRKGDTVTVEVSEEKVVFSSTNGGKVEALFSDEPKKDFPPVDLLLGKETGSRIPVLEPVEFKQAVKLALIARRDGERVFKTEVEGNLIHVISTSRKTTVFGKSRHNGCRSITHLQSDERSTGATVILNGAYLLDLISVLPKNQPYELRQWANGKKGIAVLTPEFEHRLGGISKRKEEVSNV
jgi:DNA polymerase III sliding clamp (beta) subunit (PCNA family)